MAVAVDEAIITGVIAHQSFRGIVVVAFAVTAPFWRRHVTSFRGDCQALAVCCHPVEVAEVSQLDRDTATQSDRNHGFLGWNRDGTIFDAT